MMLWWLMVGWIVVLVLVVVFGLGYVLGADRSMDRPARKTQRVRRWR